MKENWKDIAGYEGLYQVSNLGRIKSLERTVRTKGNGVKEYSYTLPEKVIRPHKQNSGYLVTDLCKNGVKKHHLVHRLVAEAFIPNDDIFATTVNHIDEDKTNNRADNLEWLSHGDNMRYSMKGETGREWEGRNHASKKVLCVETGEIFESTTKASRWLGFSSHVVSVSILKGYRAGGYHWEYLKDKEGLCNASQRT